MTARTTIEGNSISVVDSETARRAERITAAVDWCRKNGIPPAPWVLCALCGQPYVTPLPGVEPVPLLAPMRRRKRAW